ncbi:hypothetical protein EJB05_03076, partial [Eragrostis curvula]
MAHNLRKYTAESWEKVRQSAGDSWEYHLRKYLLLLATLVATVTYTAGFNPPGGVWQDADAAAGHIAGDPIIRDTSYRRYVVFFYFNATAFASSLVVIVLILILAVVQEKRKEAVTAPVLILRSVMVLDLFSIMGAYAAGTCRDKLTAVYSSVLVLLLGVYVVIQVALATYRPDKDADFNDLQKQRKMLMPLATFAASVTYLAGLSAPGGFWNNSEDGHRPGQAILKGRHDARLQAFFVFNTTAFVASLLIVVLLLDKKLRWSNKVRIPWSPLTIVPEQVKKRIPRRLYGIIILALIGLLGAYAAGSCRETDTTIYVNSLIFAVLVCIGLQLFVLKNLEKQMNSLWEKLEGIPDEGLAATNSGVREGSLSCSIASHSCSDHHLPGRFRPTGWRLWEDDGVGYKAGDPILQTTNPRRYKAFFYCNSVAFVASLVAIILARKETLHKHNSLEAAMILDLFGLIGAYAAGSCRDVNTSIYAMGLAGIVLVYVVIHVVLFTMDHGDSDVLMDNDLVEKRRKRLLRFAILAATITYQAGLTPPSGFRLKDDESGHHAGDPVLHYNFPRRYKAFFYCNSVSFMLSIALIILLVNKNLYRPAIRSNALSVCTAAGMFSLVGAYAAGSTQHLKTSIYIFALAAVVLIFIAVLVVVFMFITDNEREKKIDEKSSREDTADEESRRTEETRQEPLFAPMQLDTKASKEKQVHDTEFSKENVTHDTEAEVDKKIHAKRKYLMLLGILVASVTYQAGLKPPGGVWQSDDGGHFAGNPIMHNNRRSRYLAFFYSNSTSYVASIVVIILLLLESLQQEKSQQGELPQENTPQGNLPQENTQQGNLPQEKSQQGELQQEKLWPLRVMNTTIALDLLGLLVAYAVGSSRSWKTTGYVLALVIAVLAYVGMHVLLSTIIRRRKNEDDMMCCSKVVADYLGIEPGPQTRLLRVIGSNMLKSAV